MQLSSAMTGHLSSVNKNEQTRSTPSPSNQGCVLSSGTVKRRQSDCFQMPLKQARLEGNVDATNYNLTNNSEQIVGTPQEPSVSFHIQKSSSVTSTDSTVPFSTGLLRTVKSEVCQLRARETQSRSPCEEPRFVQTPTQSAFVEHCERPSEDVTVPRTISPVLSIKQSKKGGAKGGPKCRKCTIHNEPSPAKHRGCAFVECPCMLCAMVDLSNARSGVTTYKKKLKACEEKYTGVTSKKSKNNKQNDPQEELRLVKEKLADYEQKMEQYQNYIRNKRDNLTVAEMQETERQLTDRVANISEEDDCQIISIILRENIREFFGPRLTTVKQEVLFSSMEDETGADPEETYPDRTLIHPEETSHKTEIPSFQQERTGGDPLGKFISSEQEFATPNEVVRTEEVGELVEIVKDEEALRTKEVLMAPTVLGTEKVPVTVQAAQSVEVVELLGVVKSDNVLQTKVVATTTTVTRPQSVLETREVPTTLQVVKAEKAPQPKKNATAEEVAQTEHIAEPLDVVVAEKVLETEKITKLKENIAALEQFLGTLPSDENKFVREVILKDLVKQRENLRNLIESDTCDSIDEPEASNQNVVVDDVTMPEETFTPTSVQSPELPTLIKNGDQEIGAFLASIVDNDVIDSEDDCVILEECGPSLSSSPEESTTPISVQSPKLPMPIKNEVQETEALQASIVENNVIDPNDCVIIAEFCGTSLSSSSEESTTPTSVQSPDYELSTNIKNEGEENGAFQACIVDNLQTGIYKQFTNSAIDSDDDCVILEECGPSVIPSSPPMEVHTQSEGVEGFNHKQQRWIRKSLLDAHIQCAHSLDMTTLATAWSGLEQYEDEMWQRLGHDRHILNVPKRTTRMPCCLCSNYGHWPDECSRFPAPVQRRKRAHQLALCQKCNFQHRRNDCRKEKCKCSICGSFKHSPAYCERRSDVVSKIAEAQEQLNNVKAGYDILLAARCRFTNQ